MRLKVMTYNICSGLTLFRERDISKSAGVIQECKPDLVALNEVRMGTEDIGGAIQADQLSKLLGMNYVFGKSINILGGAYGNALLSRYPILSSEVIHIPDIPPKERDTWFEHRSVLRAIIDVDGIWICVLVSHFGLSTGEQVLAVETVRQIASIQEHPVIFMGDLNAIPENTVLQPLYTC